MQKICFLLIALLALACADKDIILTGSGGDEEQSFYRIEIEPSLSTDRSTILMVRADTSSTTLNGIYSARVSNPVRNAKYLGENISSPTKSVDGNLIGFQQNSNLYLFDISLDSLYRINISQNFSELLFITEFRMLGSSGSSLFVIDLLNGSSLLFAQGFLPTAYVVDTIAYLASLKTRFHTINLGYPIPNNILKSANVASSAIVIDTIIGTKPISFGIEPTLQRYCYSVQQSGTFIIYAGGVGIDSVWQVAESKYAGVVMLDHNTIIFTGVDGRLYRTDFFGKSSYPFWAG